MGGFAWIYYRYTAQGEGLSTKNGGMQGLLPTSMKSGALQILWMHRSLIPLHM